MERGTEMDGLPGSDDVASECTKSRVAGHVSGGGRGSDLSSDKAASIRPSSSVRIPIPARAFVALRFSGSCTGPA